MKYRVTAEAFHHTTDSVCCSVDVPYAVPEFFVEAEDDEAATALAMAVVCPMADALQYEGVTVNVVVTRVDT